jgi:hypothetical protein
MSNKLNAANPIANNATMVCKTISLVASFFMARSFPDSQKLKTIKPEFRPAGRNQGPGAYPPGPRKPD